MPLYRWVNDPPVVEVQLQDVSGVVQAFQDSVRGIAGNPGEYGAFSASKASDSIDISDGFKNQFNGALAQQLARRAGRRVFRYDLDGGPVGLIDISIRAGDVYVEHVVGHAGTENAGDILIEYIIRFSPVNPPVVRLFAATDAAANAYRRIGFVNDNAQNGSGPMTLDLGTQHGLSKWSYVGNRWKLTAAVNLGYMTNA